MSIASQFLNSFSFGLPKKEGKMQVSCNTIREPARRPVVTTKGCSSTLYNTTESRKESITQSCDDYYFSRNKNMSLRRPKTKFSHSDNKSIIFVGEEYSGRTSLMDRIEQKFRLSQTDKECYHWEEDGTACSKLVNEDQYLILLDMERQTSYNKGLREFYNNIDMFVVCYDLSNETSFEHVYNKWIKEIKVNHPRTSFIVVGCKSDIDFRTRHLVSVSPKGKKYKSHETAALDMGASAYIECSSWHATNIERVYEAATGIVLPGRLSPDTVRKSTTVRRTKSLVGSLRSSFRKK